MAKYLNLPDPESFFMECKAIMDRSRPYSPLEMPNPHIGKPRYVEKRKVSAQGGLPFYEFTIVLTARDMDGTILKHEATIYWDSWNPFEADRRDPTKFNYPKSHEEYMERRTKLMDKITTLAAEKMVSLGEGEYT